MDSGSAADLPPDVADVLRSWRVEQDAIIVEQATGVLMGMLGCTAGQALDLLSRLAHRDAVPVEEAAMDVIRRAERAG